MSLTKAAKESLLKRRTALETRLVSHIENLDNAHKRRPDKVIIYEHYIASVRGALAEIERKLAA